MSRRRGRGATMVVVALAVALLSWSPAASGRSHTGVEALFFGDSLIQGTGTLPRHPLESQAVEAALGWAIRTDGYGGTGYTTGGKHGHSYLSRLRHDGALRTSYDVIVLEGGTNDARYGSLTTLRAAVLRTVDYVHQRQPWARIVLVGGYAPPGIDATRYAQVDAVLGQVASTRHLQYVSQFGFHATATSADLSDDGFHPSDKGYRQLSAELTSSLRG